MAGEPQTTRIAPPTMVAFVDVDGVERWGLLKSATVRGWGDGPLPDTRAVVELPRLEAVIVSADTHWRDIWGNVIHDDDRRIPAGALRPEHYRHVCAALGVTE